MIEYGDPETWGMKVDQFLDTSNEQLGTIELADGGVVEREGFYGGTDPNELLSQEEIKLFEKEIEDAYPGVKINDTKAGKINPRTINDYIKKLSNYI